MENNWKGKAEDGGLISMSLACVKE